LGWTLERMRIVEIKRQVEVKGRSRPQALQDMQGIFDQPELVFCTLGQGRW